ncbi:MAG: ATP synthase F1 subunit delta [Phycisphaerae bacterium]|nr:ATP synthase F1 subunit delta [Phycisphaerae bacterium]
MGSQWSRQVAEELYTEVLFELAEQAGCVDTIHADLQKAAAVMAAEPDFAAVLNSLTLQGKIKCDSVRKVFQGAVSDLALDFLSVLARRNRFGLLAAIVRRYETLFDIYHKRYPLEVTVAGDLTPEQVDQMRQRLASAIQSDIKLTVKVDRSLIGGIVIRKDDMIIDSSVRTALERAARAVSDPSQLRPKGPERKGTGAVSA